MSPILIIICIIIIIKICKSRFFISFGAVSELSFKPKASKVPLIIRDIIIPAKWDFLFGRVNFQNSNVVNFFLKRTIIKIFPCTDFYITQIAE
jgi:hypothetical protein